MPCRAYPRAVTSGAVLDVWFNRVISQQVGGGGMAFFDPVRLSSHGRSWRQTRFHLNGIDITDPARPGEPLFELPYDAWDGVAYRSLWTARPGVDVSFRAEAPDTWRLTGAAGQDVGGGTWIPGGLFDRSLPPSMAPPLSVAACERWGNSSRNGRGVWERRGSFA